jgi:hypothetical protein
MRNFSTGFLEVSKNSEFGCFKTEPLLTSLESKVQVPKLVLVVLGDTVFCSMNMIITLVSNRIAIEVS